VASDPAVQRPKGQCFKFIGGIKWLVSANTTFILPLPKRGRLETIETKRFENGADFKALSTWLPNSKTVLIWLHSSRDEPARIATESDSANGDVGRRFESLPTSLSSWMWASLHFFPVFSKLFPVQRPTDFFSRLSDFLYKSVNRSELCRELWCRCFRRRFDLTSKRR